MSFVSKIGSIFSNKNRVDPYSEASGFQRKREEEASAQSLRHLGYSKEDALAMAQGAPYRPPSKKDDTPKKDAALASSLGATARAVDQKLTKDGVSKKSAKSDYEKQAREAERQRKREEERIRNSILSGWGDTGATVERAQKAQERARNAVSSLGKVRDQVVSSLDNLHKRKQEAITGNEELIQRNQRGALDNLADIVRRRMDSANVALGAANDGSAGRMAGRAIASEAGRNRANIFTQFGDQFSQQKQARRQAQEEFDTGRLNAYEWEEERRRMAEEDLAAQGQALQHLLNNRDIWQNEDLRAQATDRLNAFLSSLASATGNYDAIRSGIEDTMTEYGGRAEELDNASTGVLPPAELDTPKFDPSMDISQSTQDDWYDPQNTQNKPERKIAGYDAYGNPIYEDELV